MIAAVGPELEGGAREEVDARGLDAAARRRRRPRAPQRAGPCRLGGLRDRDGGAGGRRRDDGGRHAAQRPPADGRRRGLRRASARAASATRASTSRSGAGSSPATSTRWTSWPSAAWSGTRRSWPTAGSTTSRPPTTSRSTRACAARRRSGCRWRSTPRAARSPPACSRAAAAEGRTAMRDWLDSRPAVAETEAIARAIHLAEAAGCALHVVHVSTGRGVALVAEARARGADVSLRDLPALPAAHRGGRRAPRRGREVRAAAAPGRGARGAVGARSPTARCRWSPPTTRPRRRSMKEGDVLHAWGGIAGAQTTLPLVLGEDRLPPERVAEVLAGFPARRLRLARKGADRAGRRRRPRARRPGGARRAARRGPAPAPPRLAVHRAARCARGSCARSCAGGRCSPTGGSWASRFGRLVTAGMSDGLDAAIDRLAQFNDDPEAGGITREVFTPTYAEALEWVAERMRGAGLETRLDAFGNLWGRWAGSEPDARASSPARTSTRRSTPAATTASSACWARSRRCARCATSASRRAAASR